MTKKSRTLLFFICVIAFFLITPLVLFYIQGYRVDFNKQKIVQVGAFYFNVSPPKAEVYLTPLNNKRPSKILKEKTNFLLGSILVKNLLPKIYKIEIKKDGYHPWQKNLEIKEKQVTEAKNILLIPKKLNFIAIDSNTENFFPSPDNKKLIIKKSSSSENEQYFTLLDLEKNTQTPILKNNTWLKKGELLNLIWFPDSTKFILQFIIKEEKKCFLVELDKDFSLNYFSFLENTEKIYFNTQNYKELFILKENKIFLLNLKKDKTEKKFLLKNISAFNICNKDIYYLDNSGFLFKTDFSFKKKEILNKTPLSLKDTANYEIKIFGDFIFIQEENIFYLFEPKEHLFKKFFEPINIIKISPDAKKIAFCSEHEIWLLFLKEQLDQPQKKAGQEIFIARFSKKINDCLWLNNDYLIFTSENIIKITEIDDRNKINIISFDEFSSLKEKKLYKIFWNQNNKKLYILNEKKLFVSEKLIK